MANQLDTSELRNLLSVAEEASKIAEDIILPLYTEDISFQLKPDQTPVTIADQKAEEAIWNYLQKETPNYAVLGEELGQSEKISARKWVIDPIDGTKSFIQKVPLFGTLISLEIDDCPVLGVIACHALKETATAAIGLGTELNKRSVTVTDKKNIEDAIVLTTDPKSFYNRTKTGFSELLRAQQFRSWGDCYGYLAVACGRADIMIDDVINPWDISAASIIVTEAGGKFSSWDGVDLLGKDAIATNGFLHTELCEILK
tara:strand:+ start:3802 stop:4575 length:774 start_codon:yes stop_codon:yes gene_type:complete